MVLVGLQVARILRGNMNILYIGRHGQKNNDDEGEIAYSLTQLGCNVTLCHSDGLTEKLLESIKTNYDIALFHKLPIDLIKVVCDRWKGVAWFFDPIDKGFRHNDIYAYSIRDIVYKGFFTDGDFVDTCKDEGYDNIFNLYQGFDFSTGFPMINLDEKRDLLFIGTISIPSYDERREYLIELSKEFGPMAHTQYSIFKDDLTKVCHETKVMLGMPPCSDKYWSNRIYLLGGRGAFLIHPYSEGLYQQFPLLPMYKDLDDLKEKIKYYCDDRRAIDRLLIRNSLQETIKNGHCYIHRVQKLLETL